MKHEILSHFENGLQSLRRLYLLSCPDNIDPRTQLTVLARNAKDAFNLVGTKSYIFREQLTMKSKQLLLFRSSNENEIQSLKRSISACECSINIKRKDMDKVEEEIKNLQRELINRKHEVEKSGKDHANTSTGIAAIGRQIGVGVAGIAASFLTGGALGRFR